MAKRPQDTKKRDALISLYHQLRAVHINPEQPFMVRGFNLRPFYVDGMCISTSVEGLELVTELMLGHLDGVDFDVVAAPSISGIPYASVLANKLKRRLVIDRGLPSKYGLKRRIEGEIRKGDKVVIVDDIAKRGQTLVEVSEQVRERGGEIVKAIVVVDATSAHEKKRLLEDRLDFEGVITLEELGVNPNMQLDVKSQA